MLPAGQYLLYAAPAREINNHKLLLTAFGIFRSRRPGSDIRLVCAAPQDPECLELERLIRYLGLGGRVRFVHAESAVEEAAFLHGCRAVIFPSLQATQADLLLHALEFSKPIFCGDLDGLPDGARGAAKLFDPRKPLDIVRAFELASGVGPVWVQL